MSVVASSATYISTEFNMSEIFVVMTDQIKHNFRNVQFKHTFLPVLGEFLFYAAKQEENEDKLIPNWEPTGDKLNEFGLWDDVFYLKFFCKIFHEKSYLQQTYSKREPIKFLETLISSDTLKIQVTESVQSMYDSFFI